MWRELVRTMKEEQDSPNSCSAPNNNNNNGRRRKKSSSGEISGGKDDILGLIKIGGGIKVGGSGDAVSITSGLTSAEGTNSPNKKSTPSPLTPDDMWVDDMVTGTIGVGADDDAGGLEGGGECERMRSITPPNVPILSNKGGDLLPMVSPLSVDGSMDTDDDSDDDMWKDQLNILGDSDDDDDDDGKGQGMKNNMNDKGGEEGKTKDVFFDVGETFADNTKHLWNDPALAATTTENDPAMNSPKIDWGDHLALADLNSEGENSEKLSPLPPKLPQPRSPRDGSTVKNIWKGITATSTVKSKKDAGYAVLDVEEEEVDEAFAFEAFSEPEQQGGAVQEQQPNPLTPPSSSSKESDFDTDLIQDVVVKDSTTKQQPTPSSSKQRRAKKGSKSATPTLEEQILSVLQQQPESHTVEEREEKEEEIVEEAELFERSASPFLPSQTTTSKSNKKPTSGGSRASTRGSAASAQDILRELRSSTPSTLHSGNSSKENNKPLPGSISIGGKRRQQQKKKVDDVQDFTAGAGAAVAFQQQATSSPSSETESSNKVVCGNNTTTSTTPSASTRLLAPSKRDLPRPNRLRRSASEPKTPHAVGSASASTSTVTMSSIGSSKLVSPTATSVSTNTTATSNASASTKAMGNLTKTTAASSEKSSPSQSFHKMNNNNMPPLINRGGHLRRLFPNTSPASVNNPPSQPQGPVSQQRDPFDSPPRQNVESNVQVDPFEEQSSPIFPMEQSTEEDHTVEINLSLEPFSFEESAIITSPNTSLEPGTTSLPPQQPALLLAPSHSSTRTSSNKGLKTNIPASATPKAAAYNDTSPNSSQSTKSSLEEIRATISELKNNGVGGVGHSTSTLARNEETGRYVIRDVDDDMIFRDMLKPKVIDEGSHESSSLLEVDNEEVLEEGPSFSTSLAEFEDDNSVEEGTGGSSHHSSLNASEELFPFAAITTEHSTSMEGKTRPLMYMLRNESVMGDDAVDAAVLVATESQSVTTASTDSDCVVDVEEEKEEDLFVIRRPPSNAKWNDANWCMDEDDFDIRPSVSMDDWEVGEDDDFALGTQWDDGDNNDDAGRGSAGDDSWWMVKEEEKEVKNKKTTTPTKQRDDHRADALPSPTSVVASKRKLFERGGL